MSDGPARRGAGRTVGGRSWWQGGGDIRLTLLSCPTLRMGMPTHLFVAMVAAQLATLFAVGRLWWIVRRR